MNIHRAQRILLAVDAVLIVLLALSFVVEPYALIERQGAGDGAEGDTWHTQAMAALKPFEHYQKAMSGRVIFKSPMEEVVRASQKRLIDDFEFLGSSRLGSRARGYVRNTETGESRTVSVGDRIGDYEVIEVDTSSVILQKGSDTFALGR